MDDVIRITANPSAVDPMRCTFQVDRPVLPGKSFYFGSPLRGKGSPLIERIFQIGSIESVHVSHDQIHIVKTTDDEWRIVGKQVGAAIRETLAASDPPISPAVFDDMLSPERIRELVAQVLESQVNPMVASHGGHIALHGVEGNDVHIEMSGGCQGCGMATATLKLGVERLIREFVPEVGDIVDVTDHSSGHNPYYAAAE